MSDGDRATENAATRVTLQPSGHSYPAWPGQSLLEAGLGAGLALPFRCSNGSCGDCRARVVSGSISRLRQHDYVLSESDKLAGHCLMCSNAPDGPVVLEVQEARSVDDIPQQSLTAKRCHLETTDDVQIVRFKFVRGKAFRFLPGQNALLQLADGQSACLPIASCPCDTSYVEFHLPARGPTACHTVTEAIAALASRERVTVSGPTGRFTIRESLNRPQLFLASGIGFAALQGLVEHCLTSEPAPATHLLWARSGEVGHYRRSLCRAWSDAFDEFTFALLDSPLEVPPEVPSAADVYVATGAEPLLQALQHAGYTPATITHQADHDQTGAQATS